MRRGELPDRLGAAFHVSTALAAGASASRLRASDLETPFRGVRVRADPPPATLRDEERMRMRALAYAARMLPHEFFSHVTAAVLWGIPLPSSVVDPGRLDVGVFEPVRDPRRSGVTGHRMRPALATVRAHAVHGVLLTSPASTWAALGAVLEDPRDLVAAGDAVVRIGRRPGGFGPPPAPPLAAMSELTAAVAAGRRVGIGRLRGALPLVRTGSASRTESWTRLVLTAAGLPEPVLDHDVYDAGGRFLACVDLAYPERRIAIEYEGDHHRSDPRQWAKDVDRIERLVENGWRVIRVTKALLFAHPQELVRRVSVAREPR